MLTATSLLEQSSNALIIRSNYIPEDDLFGDDVEELYQKQKEGVDGEEPTQTK